MIISFLIALILFLPTTVFVGAELYLLLPLIAAIFHRKELIKRFRYFKSNLTSWKSIKTVWLVLFIIGLIFLISVFGKSSFVDVIMGPVVLFPITLIAAYLINDRNVIYFLLLFIGVESIVGGVEFIMGTNTFFTFDPNKTNLNYNSLYYSRVFGLGFNSTYLSQKALVGVLILLFTNIKIPRWSRIVLFSLFVMAIVITFGRTTLIVFSGALIIFLASKLLLLRQNRGLLKKEKDLFVMVSLTLVAYFLFFNFWNVQFSRQGLVPRDYVSDVENTQLQNENFILDETNNGVDVINEIGLGNVEMSGRREMWAMSINFISKNLWLGNYGKRYLVHNKHVHNSFLEYFTTNGLIVFLSMLFFILFNLTKKNFIFIFCLSLYSMGQFGILWDISFLDIIFFSILLFGVDFTKKELA